MARGISKETVKSFVLDAGVVYLNYNEIGERILGATNGGNTFNVEREVKEMEADNLKGKTKGFRRVISENATMKVNLKELSAENIRLALNAEKVYDEVEDPDYEIIKSKGEITDEDYIKNVALVAKINGSSKPIIILLYNALVESNLELNLQDKDEGVIELELAAHYEPKEDGTMSDIYGIRYPKIPKV